MKKHIWLPFSIWFSVLQCFCWNWELPVSAETTQTLRTADGIYYEILDNQTIQITGSKDTLSELVISNEIDGLPVTKIKDYAFVNHTRLRSVSISESVLEIGSYAFIDCSRLEMITVPDTVQDVGWGIFSHTPWLNAQTEPYVIIGNQILIAYKGTSEDIVIPDGVRIIAGFTFENDMTIQSVQLPDSLISLNAYAFAGCRNLQELQLPGQDFLHQPRIHGSGMKCRKSERMHFLSASSCRVCLFRILCSKLESRRFISVMLCDAFGCRRVSRKSAPGCSIIVRRCRRSPFPILSGFRVVHH